MGPNISGGTEYFIFSAEIFSPNILSRGTKLGEQNFFMTGVQCLLGNMYHAYMQELNVVVFIFVPRSS